MSKSPQRQYFTVRVGNIPHATKDEDVVELFQQYGKIVDFQRPMNLGKHRPSPFAFIRYERDEDALRAIEEMDYRIIWESRLQVSDGNKQSSYFTQDTGFITNEEFDVPKAPQPDFDSSLPSDHYLRKRKEEIKQFDTLYSVRIDDLHPDISKEMLDELFSPFGEIAQIYFPVDLKHMCKPKGFAFVRYIRENDARRAAREMNNVNLGVGRNVLVEYLPPQKRFFSQDESVPTDKKHR